MINGTEDENDASISSMAEAMKINISLHQRIRIRFSDQAIVDWLNMNILVRVWLKEFIVLTLRNPATIMVVRCANASPERFWCK